MAGKFKVDLSRVKEFFLDKGEKIALGVCVLAAGLLVTMGMLDAASVRTAPNSQKSYALALKDVTKSLETKVVNAPFNPETDKDPANKFRQVPWEWVPANLNFDFRKLFDLPDSNSSKRLNPRVKAVLAGADTIDMKYVAGSYFAHDIIKSRQTIVVFKPADNANNGNPVPQFGVRGRNNQAVNAEPAIITRPLRMVVVTGVFPMREQLLEFQNMFRMQSQGELFASKDLPHILGLNIWKSEVVGKEDDWKPLVVAKKDPMNGEVKIEVDEALKKLFREALLDEENLALYSPFLLQGLAMPLPRLAILPNGQYPPVKLAGLEADENTGNEGNRGGGAMGRMNMKQFNPFAGGKDGGGAMGGAGGNNQVRDDAFPWQKLKAELQDKLNDRTNILDPLLFNFDPEEEKKDNDQPQAHMDGKAAGFEGNSPFASREFWKNYSQLVAPAGAKEMSKRNPTGTPQAKPYDAMFRFVDPTVEPGKTYRYRVQVRMANPNFGKKEDVAFPSLAELKELESSWPVDTPTITIPEEYFLYAVDQKPAYKVLRGSNWDAPNEKKQEHVAVQIHRWVDETGPSKVTDKVIGDWCIAERLYIRRGDPVGKPIYVEMPVWNSETNRFELGKSAEDAAGEKAAPRPTPKGMQAMPAAGGAAGTQVNFAVTTPPPVLVDFDGGKRSIRIDVSATSPGRPVQDESASDLLILRADGSLIVRNTRADSETDTPAGKERVQRIETWKAKTDPFRMLNNQNGPGNPFGPGRPNPFKS